MIGDLIAGLVGKVVERLIPDPAQKAQLALELEKMKQAGEFKEIDAELERSRQQTDINKEEAKSTDKFTSRGRPFIIWMCGFSLGYAAIIDPFARFIATVVYDYSGAFPAIDTAITLQILLGLLGLSGMRSYDKKNGVAS